VSEGIALHTQRCPWSGQSCLPSCMAFQDGCALIGAQERLAEAAEREAAIRERRARAPELGLMAAIDKSGGYRASSSWTEAWLLRILEVKGYLSSVSRSDGIRYYLSAAGEAALGEAVAEEAGQ